MEQRKNLLLNRVAKMSLGSIKPEIRGTAALFLFASSTFALFYLPSPSQKDNQDDLLAMALASGATLSEAAMQLEISRWTIQRRMYSHV